LGLLVRLKHRHNTLLLLITDVRPGFHFLDLLLSACASRGRSRELLVAASEHHGQTDSAEAYLCECDEVSTHRHIPSNSVDI
jgi:hypothetical protein